MYANNQVNGLGGYLGEVRQGPNGELYQLGEVYDERGNLGLGWQPYNQPQLGEVRQGADGQLYQYGMDGLGNVGFAPLAALLPSILPAVSKILPNILPGVSNMVSSLLPGILPGGSRGPSPIPGLPLPPLPIPGLPSFPAPAPSVPVAPPRPYPMPPRINYGFFNNLVPRIANTTADLVFKKLEPLLTRRRRGRRGGVAGVGEEQYLYGVGEDPYAYGMGEDPYLYGVGERDYDSLGMSQEELGDFDPGIGNPLGYSDYEPVSGMEGYMRQEPEGQLRGYVQGRPSASPAFAARESPSDLWKPLWS